MLQPVKIRRSVWWVLTVPEMQPVNLERMFGEPIRDNHLDHMFYVYQSEMVGPFGNRTDVSCPRNTARKFRRMYRQPIRDNHLDYMFYVYQSEMVGPIRNPPNMVLLLMLLTNHKTPFFKKTCPYIDRWVLCPRNPIFTLLRMLSNNLTALFFF